MDLLTIVTVVLFIALIGLVVVFGVLMLRLMKTLEATTATISKLEPTIANVEEITTEIKPTVRKIEPIVDRVQLTLDSVNLEMMRVDGILEDVSHITGNAVNATEAVDTITSAPAKAVAGVANKVRERFGTNDFLLYLIVDNGYWDTAFDRTMVEKDLLARFTTKGMDGGEDVLTGYGKAAETTATGFIFEAVIPWANFSNARIPAYTPAVGDTVNFNFAITDIDYPCPGTEYIPQMAWSGDSRIEGNPSMWRLLTFAE